MATPGKFGSYLLSSVIETAALEIRQKYYDRVDDARKQKRVTKSKHIDKAIKAIKNQIKEYGGSDTLDKQIESLKSLKKNSNPKLDIDQYEEMRLEVIDEVCSKYALSAKFMADMLGNNLTRIDEEAHEDIS